jgi:sec-independent protein translocase protein TatA
MPFNIGPGELILVLIIALIVVGPGKLPEVGAAIGRSLREFRRAASDVNEAANPPAPPPSSPSAGLPAATPSASSTPPAGVGQQAPAEARPVGAPGQNGTATHSSPS